MDKTLLKLKEDEQDFEWYPTTKEMIQAVRSLLSSQTKSILDIGAGDGRVLLAFREKCLEADFYSIEKSPLLIQQQPEFIIPAGTEFWEQNLAFLPVEIIFCNPPYSEYESWVVRIIEQGFAERAYLVIPQRWKESKEIKSALEKRKANTRIIFSGDFLSGERQARAVIDIVEVQFPLQYGRGPEDPFEKYFEQNIFGFNAVNEEQFEYKEEFLAKKFSTASIDEMVESYQDESIRLSNSYKAIFNLDSSILQELGIKKIKILEDLKSKIQKLKLKYWNLLFNKLDEITTRLTTQSKKILLSKLSSRTSVEFTTKNAYAIVIWAIRNANLYFESQLVDLFFAISYFEGVKNYKSNLRTWIDDGWRYGNRDKKNTHYILDYRIVVKTYSAIINSDDSYRRWENPGNLSKNSHELIADIQAVFSTLGFVSIQKSYKMEWVSGGWHEFTSRTGETVFRIKAFKNGNVHIEFNQQAIKALNIQAACILKWIRTKEEILTEMDYKVEDLKYFNVNLSIGIKKFNLLEEKK